jgi:hypothetical protein
MRNCTKTQHVIVYGQIDHYSTPSKEFTCQCGELIWRVQQSEFRWLNDEGEHKTRARVVWATEF